MENKFSLLYPEGYDKEQEVSMTQFDFITDLYIDNLVVPVTKGTVPWERTNVDLSRFFTTDTEVIKYRLDVVEDLINNPKLFEAIRNVLPYVIDIQELRTAKGAATDVTSCLYSITEIELYIKCIDTIYNAVKDTDNIRSEGLGRLIGFIKEIHNGEEYTTLKKDTESLTKSIRSIKSITIGVNLDAQLRPIEAGVLSINEQLFRSGSVIDRILRLDTKDDGYRCIAPLIPYGKNVSEQRALALTFALNNAIDIIFRSSIRMWQPIIRKYLSDNAAFLVHLINDFRFLIGAVDFINSMSKLGLPMCKPEVRPMEEKAFSLNGIYNPYIALRHGENKSENKRMILNDFQFDKDGMIYIFTGPNQGGKSVTTYAVGITQALFQLGLYVPAYEARLSPVDNIFTNFPTLEETTINKGRLGEECSRLSKMLDNISEYSLVLMDETLSSTSAIEATYIASEVIMGLSLVGCRCIFTTHLHDLSQKVDELNESVGNGAKIDNLVALMADEKSGVRSYKIMRVKPDGLSYAKNIAEQYGITLDRIREKHMKQ